MLRVPHVALPNLLARRALVPEFLQEAVQPGALADALLPLFGAPDAALAAEFQRQAALLRGNCAEQVARGLEQLATRGRGD